MSNCPRGKLPPNPKTNPKPNPNPNSNQGAIYLGANCPDTILNKPQALEGQIKNTE